MRARIIIDCDEADLSSAFHLMLQELQRRRDYDRPGWGWGHRFNGRKFFVRGIKGGLSVHSQGEIPSNELGDKGT